MDPQPTLEAIALGSSVYPDASESIGVATKHLSAWKSCILTQTVRGESAERFQDLRAFRTHLYLECKLDLYDEMPKRSRGEDWLSSRLHAGSEQSLDRKTEFVEGFVRKRAVSDASHCMTSQR